MMKTPALLIQLLKLNISKLVLVITFFSTNLSYSQPDYNMSLINGTRTSENVIEFDVTIKGSNSTFNLTSYQCTFLFNSSITNGGQLSFTYIEGTSQLNNLPTFGIGVNTGDGDPKLTFASMAGSDQITEANLLVGRFRLTNTNAFANIDPNITWNFEGFVSTILTGENFQNITAPNFHSSNLTLSTDSQTSDVPAEYNLAQNYPNPFNPSTKIKFSLKAESEVKLVVYNLLGEMIQELVNNKIAAGNHEYTFNSDGLSSGTYIYRLEANNEFVSTRKMMLLK